MTRGFPEQAFEAAVAVGDPTILEPFLLLPDVHLNVERKAIQVYDCNGLVVGHYALDDELVVELARLLPKVSQ